MPPDKLDFTRRADLTEWMDEPCSYGDFSACLRSLEQCNRLVLTYRPTLRWLRPFLRAGRPLHIVDVGSGGGDMLRRIEHLAGKHKTPVRLTGVDLNPHAARAAREFTPSGSAIQWITGDAFTSPLPAPPDLIISSLFTHHLPDSGIVQFLAWMERTATRGWFINDLHRQAVPYHLFKLLAKAARWHRFVQHDGPISIRRAFRAEDWQTHLNAAGIAQNQVSIQHLRPGRLCVSRVKA